MLMCIVPPPVIKKRNTHTHRVESGGVADSGLRPRAEGRRYGRSGVECVILCSRCWWCV